MTFCGVWNVLTRRKILDERDQFENSKLSRCLGTWDLTFLGVGSTLGVGVYVLAGHVARESAGPSVILSFLIAAVVSVFAGLCYAEFGARVPQAGSAYIYSYVCVGEFIAFIIGWNLILEYVIGSASVCRGISIYLDSLLNNTLRDTFTEVVPINVEFLSNYFDLLAFALALVFGALLAFGMKKSAFFNNIFTILNIFIVLFIIVIGAFKADINNWKILPESIPPEINGGSGGFFPYGIQGMMKGAATCFYGFVGFDCIATTGEEVKNPKKAIPMAIIISLAVIFLSYFGISSITTLMWPYYLQDANSPIPYIFHAVGWEWAKWVVAIGGMFGLLASLLGSMFPLPRILYAMASDGLIFRVFGKVSPHFKTPVIGTMCAALLTGTLAGLFDLGHLINMMSIGTLMAYTIVAACVLLLRYRSNTYVVCVNIENHSLLSNHGDESDEESSPGKSVYERKQDLFAQSIGTVEGMDIKFKEPMSFKVIVNQLLNVDASSEPTPLSSRIVGTLIVIYCASSVGFGLCLIYLIDELTDKVAWALSITAILGALMLMCFFLIYFQPKAKADIYFKVPLVPLIPCLSIFANIYLMLLLDVYTWIRFGIWMIIGIPVYLMSLYAYERGSNYEMYAQKTSVNGHMTGNLNYAFENIVECQERSVAFVPSEKVTKRYFDLSNPTTESNDQEAHEIVSEPINNIRQVNAEDVLVNSEEFMEPEPLSDAYKEIKIIELLDQVLQDEDDLHPMSSYESEDEESIASNPAELNVSSEISVRVSVHNESRNSVSKNDNDFSSDIENEPKVVIPIPPPIDESFFANTAKYVKSKPSSPRLDLNSKISKTDISLLSDENLPPVDSSSHLQFGTESQKSFMKKLNTLLKTPGTTKSVKLEAFKRSQSTSALEEANRNFEFTNGDTKATEKEIENNTNGTDNDSTTEMSRNDLKQKLENLFSTTPVMIRPVSQLREKKDTDSNPNVETQPPLEEVIIKKENYTNTMKLQRARFGDVLKSIQESQSRRDSIISQNKDSTLKRNSSNLATTKLTVNV